ncbi:MAG: hypothetical protein A4E20_10875 [Nitrospira sp. SG-bin2]|uniref:Gp37-like protein n=1 Tax=Nitrospira cf. moscoviensis SBR1015 TaxID=96242 RepID=UPI000A097CE5|nr:hypothetical protein [Nitrospira cf. moscoviensis SBR1015]OQW34515.1 MAG: hypothetical protein A4E20_10875 [Nitrospira sp. SG-bin2]
MRTLEEIANINTSVEGWRQELTGLRKAKPMVTFYRNKADGSPGLEYYGRVDYKDAIQASFPFKKNISTQGVIQLRFDHYISEWLRTVPNDPNQCKNIIIRVDFFRGKMRWTGLLHHWSIKMRDRVHFMEFTFNDDLQYLQFLLGPPNPVLPIPIFQFPRVLPLIGPAKWCCSTMILLNLIRQEGNLWQLPDDPFDLAQWFSVLPTEWRNWQVHIKANPLPFDDSSLWTIIATRMNPIDSVIADALEDAQLTLRYRRVFTDEGENETGILFVDRPANGALVFEITDDSAYHDSLNGTFLGGTIVQGFFRSVIQYLGGFIEDTAVSVLDNESLYPDEYYGPGFLNTLPVAPWLVFRDSTYSPMQTSELTWSPATARSVIVGGDNPAADATVKVLIETIGNIAGYFLLGGFSSLGSIISSIVMPFLVGTIFAWLEWKNVGRARNLGWAHLWELYQQGAENNSWSLSAIAAMRGGFLASRSETSHTVSLNSDHWSLPGWHYQVGTRVGTTCRGIPNFVRVAQVEEFIPSWGGDDDKALDFQVKIGQSKASMSTGERLARVVKRAKDALSNLGCSFVV